MSKLLKSKFLLGSLVVAIMFVGVVVVNNIASAEEDCTITKTLRVGSKGDEVKCLQETVGVTADGSFGPITKAAVMDWQEENDLVADGIFGPRSRTAWLAIGGAGGAVSGNFPEGCTSASGFSTKLIGVPCTPIGGTTLSPGCNIGDVASSTTGLACIVIPGAGTGTVPQTGPVTASLATDNPASGSFI